MNNLISLLVDFIEVLRIIKLHVMVNSKSYSAKLIDFHRFIIDLALQTTNRISF